MPSAGPNLVSEKKGVKGPGLPVSEADWMPGTA